MPILNSLQTGDTSQKKMWRQNSVIWYHWVTEVTTGLSKWEIQYIVTRGRVGLLSRQLTQQFMVTLWGEKYKCFIEYTFNIAIIFTRYKQAYSVFKLPQITSIFQPQKILNANSKWDNSNLILMSSWKSVLLNCLKYLTLF